MRIVDKFVPISQWKQERLTASGLSPIGHCLETAIRLAEKRMTVSYDRDTPSYPVWIILFTDGMITDGLRRARELLMEQRLKQEKDYILWLVATENADMKICQDLTNHIIVMNHKKYGSVFQWTSDCFKLLSMHKDITSNLLEKQYDLITKYKLRKGELQMF